MIIWLIPYQVLFSKPQKRYSMWLLWSSHFRLQGVDLCESAKLWRRKCEVAKAKEWRYEDATAKREDAKAKVRACKREEANYFRSFALSSLWSSLSCRSRFCCRRGWGSRMIIVFAAVGRGVRGIFLVILICEINNIEISREREGGPDPSYP